MAKLRLAVITDIHNGPDTGGKLGSKAPKLMTAFAKAANLAKPDLVVDMGDRITAGNADDSRAQMRHLKNYFNRLSAPTCHVVGNHDVKHLSRAENEAILGSSSASNSRDVNGYHLIFWNPGIENSINVTPADIEWLRADLSSTDKPSIVFSHIPLDLEPQDFVGGNRFDIAGRFQYQESAAIREVLEQSGKVVLCMAGHRHRNRYNNVNGIHYIQQQSLTNVWQKDYRVPSRAWSLIDLEDDQITVRMRGRAPMILQGAKVKTYKLAMKPVTPAMPPPAMLPPPDAPGPASL